MGKAVVCGRIGVDFYPDRLETPLRAVASYTRFVGGFAGNVSAGLARLGVEVAVVSRVGADGHGEFIRDWLAKEGVDVRFLGTDPYWPTPLAFCEIWPPDRFPVLFYRRPTTPDWQLVAGDFDEEEVASSSLLITSGTGLAQSPSRETTLAAMGAHRGTTIFDLDWRPALWDDHRLYPEFVRDAVAAADVVIGSEEEVQAAELPEVPRLVLKRGSSGVSVIEHGEQTDIPAYSVDVVSGLGAGDALAAAVCHGVLTGLDLVEAARRGNVAGALVAAQLSCSDAMPRLKDLDVAVA